MHYLSIYTVSESYGAGIINFPHLCLAKKFSYLLNAELGEMHSFHCLLQVFLMLPQCQLGPQQETDGRFRLGILRRV